MRQPPKKKKINIITIEEPIEPIERIGCFGDVGVLPDYFYEDSDCVKICREDIVYLYDDYEHNVAEHFINQWSEEENEDFSEFCIERRANTNTPQDI